MPHSEYFYSAGKLLLTGEYLVLKGAKVLALPLNVGQGLLIENSNVPGIYWKTSEFNETTFTAVFNPVDFSFTAASHPEKARFISNLFLAARMLNPDFLKENSTLKITATIEFNSRWGLGTSSTLINNIAQWAKVDAFKLHQMVSKGSGYDIACAMHRSPIIFQNLNNEFKIERIPQLPDFFQHLVLVYQNQKMATEANISTFLSDAKHFTTEIEQVNQLTQKIISCNQVSDVISLFDEHEELISRVLGQIPVKQQYFGDFKGAIKSLGAWGGDFMLVASVLSFEEQKAYFENKGFSTVLTLGSLLAY